MAEGTGKRIIKHIAWWRYAVDLWITRKIMRLRGEKLFELRGSCVRCGRCCEHPTIQMTEVAYHISWIRNSIIWWQTHVNRFKLHKDQKFDALLVFTCSHFNPETRTCDAYSTRPGMCRDYPMNQAYSVNPTFFEECGFYAVDKRAKSFRAALEKTGLPPEKLEELFERLHLND